MRHSRRNHVCAILVLLLFGLTRPSESGQDDWQLAQVAVAGMREALERLNSVEIDFLKIRSGTDEQLDTFDLAYLREASYAEIVPWVGVRGKGNPFGDRTMARIRFVQHGERIRFHVFKDAPSFMDFPFEHEFAFDGIKGQQLIISEPQNRLAIMEKDDFDNFMILYSGPFKLFSHYYFRGKTPRGYEHKVSRYVDMIDRSGAQAALVNGVIEIRSQYALDEERDIEDVEDPTFARECTMKIGTENYLPQSIEYISPGEVRHSFLLEVDHYFEKDGVSFPERGSFSYIRNEKLMHIVYYIVDKSTARFNRQIPDSTFTITPEPGTFVFDKMLNTHYRIE